MKHVLRSQKGVTLLEGLVALLLLSVVATGTFGVLLSTSRKSAGPDIREEMALAVAHAQEELRLRYNVSNTTKPEGFATSPCSTDNTDLFDGEVHNISCLLPPLCDKAKSSFTVQVKSQNVGLPYEQGGEDVDANSALQISDSQVVSHFSAAFDITCNGFTL